MTYIANFDPEYQAAAADQTPFTCILCGWTGTREDTGTIPGLPGTLVCPDCQFVQIEETA